MTRLLLLLRIVLTFGCTCVVLLPLRVGAVTLFFFSSRRRHTRYWRDWSSDVCSSDLTPSGVQENVAGDQLHPAGGGLKQQSAHGNLLSALHRSARRGETREGSYASRHHRDAGRPHRSAGRLDDELVDADRDHGPVHRSLLQNHLVRESWIGGWTHADLQRLARHDIGRRSKPAGRTAHQRRQLA